MALVRGGTTTTKQDAVNRRLAHETEVRRKEQDAAVRLSKQSPKEARLYNRKLGGNAHVVLKIPSRDSQVEPEWIVCELSAEDSESPLGVELTLVMVCPVCVLRNGKSQTYSQMTLKQSNRGFTLDPKRKGEVWANPLDPTDVYVLAGTVTTHESFRCDHGCQTRYRIDDSVLRIV